MAKYILAIDQGTTGTTTCIINQSGRLIASASEEITQFYPQTGWVEHDPDLIWRSVVKTIGQVINKSSIKGNEIAAIGVTNQRETVVLWERNDSHPVHKAIVWQCRRTTDFCNGLRKKGYEKKIKDKTGLVIDPYFSASKIRWLLKNIEGLKRRSAKGELAFGTIDSFLLWRLTNGVSHKSDVSNSSRTQLMNLQSGHWDKDLLKLFGIPSQILPEIVPSSGQMGVTKGVEGLPDGIPISGMAGDQQAALFGQTCFEPGEAKCTFGTGSFILMNTGKIVRSHSGLLTTVAWQLKNKPLIYALEGGAFICGAAVQWLRDGLALIERSADIEKLAEQASDTQGIEFVPALTGLGAPYWDPQARGLISGLTRGSTKAHLARATLESMALQNADILVAMQKDLKKRLKSLKVDGGAAANNLLMQIQADYLGTELIRPQIIETTALGVAYLSGLGIGFWNDLDEIKKIWKTDQNFKSNINSYQRRDRFKNWHLAISRTRLSLKSQFSVKTKSHVKKSNGRQK